MKSPATWLSVLSAFLAWHVSTPLYAESVHQAAISIVIDDVGNEYRSGMRAVNLPGPITYAVLPQSPFGQALAKQAYRRGKEVMLHMPMDNQHGVPLGPGGLTSTLNQSEFVHKLESAIAWVPHISGVNNHMGSRLTQSNRQMQWLMGSIKRYPLYFLDSRTSAETVAEQVAQQHQIPTLRRDVFLDHDASPTAIHQQFVRLLEVAKTQGTAVAIGHPYPATLGYLETVLPQLDKLGIRLVSPSALLEIRQARAPALPSTPKPAAKIADGAAKTQCRQKRELKVTRVFCG